MTRIFIPTKSPSDWRRLLAKPELHWKKGYSAMTAAGCWEGAGGKLPEEIRKVCQESRIAALEGLDLLAAFPEWEVKLPGGRQGSHTDVMALARNESGLVAISAEAKVNEPFGPTLGEKKKGASIGQRERIDYLQELLKLDAPLKDDVRYQLLHRTGAALLTARQFHAGVAVMLVHSFSPTGAWRDDFEAFCSALSAKAVTPDMFVVERFESTRLFLAWCKGNVSYLDVDAPGAAG